MGAEISMHTPSCGCGGFYYTDMIYTYKWANALVPPTPFSGRSGGERSAHMCTERANMLEFLKV